MKNFLISIDSASDFDSDVEIGNVLPLIIAKRNEIHFEEPLVLNTKENREQYYAICDDESIGSSGTNDFVLAEFLSCFERLIYPTLHFSISDKFSGTCGTVERFFKFLKTKNDKINFICFDTQNVSAGQLLLYDYADKLSETLDFEQAINVLERVREKVRTLFYVDNLKKLNIWGRLKTKIKPFYYFKNRKFICEIKNGEVVFLRQVNGEKLANRFLLDEIKNTYDTQCETPVYVTKAVNKETALELENQMKSFGIKTKSCQVSPIVSVHSGSSVVGVSFISK